MACNSMSRGDILKHGFYVMALLLGKRTAMGKRASYTSSRGDSLCWEEDGLASSFNHRIRNRNT